MKFISTFSSGYANDTIKVITIICYAKIGQYYCHDFTPFGFHSKIRGTSWQCHSLTGWVCIMVLNFTGKGVF